MGADDRGGMAIVVHNGTLVGKSTWMGGVSKSACFALHC